MGKTTSNTDVTISDKSKKPVTKIWSAGTNVCFFYTEDKALMRRVIALKDLTDLTINEVGTYYNTRGYQCAWQIVFPKEMESRIKKTIKKANKL